MVADANFPERLLDICGRPVLFRVARLVIFDRSPVSTCAGNVMLVSLAVNGADGFCDVDIIVVDYGD